MVNHGIIGLFSDKPKWGSSQHLPVNAWKGNLVYASLPNTGRGGQHFLEKPKVMYPVSHTSTRNNQIQPDPTTVLRGSCIKTDRIKLVGDLAGDATDNGPQPWLTTGELGTWPNL